LALLFFSDIMREEKGKYTVSVNTDLPVKLVYEDEKPHFYANYTKNISSNLIIAF